VPISAQAVCDDDGGFHTREFLDICRNGVLDSLLDDGNAAYFVVVQAENDRSTPWWS